MNLFDELVAEHTVAYSAHRHNLELIPSIQGLEEGADYSIKEHNSIHSTHDDKCKARIIRIYWNITHNEQQY